MPKQQPSCTQCGSADVVCDAYASWDVDKQEWVLENTFESTDCRNCDGQCSVEWIDVL